MTASMFSLSLSAYEQIINGNPLLVKKNPMPYEIKRYNTGGSGQIFLA